MFSDTSRRLVPVFPQFVLVFLPTGTELFCGNVMECAAALERHVPRDVTMAEIVQRGYRIRRAVSR